MKRWYGLLAGFCVIGCTSQLTLPIGNNLSKPIAIALDPTRSRGYVVSANTDDTYTTGSVMVLDLSTPSAPIRLANSANPATLVSLSGEVAFDNTNRRLLIANRNSDDDADVVDQVFSVNVDEGSANFLAVDSTDASQNPFGVACCDTSSRFYAVSPQGFLDVYSLDLKTRTTVSLTGTTTAGSEVSGLAATRAVVVGTQLFVATEQGAIIVINTSEIGTGANPIDYVITGGTAYQGIATDGKLLYAVDAQATPVLVIIDPASLTAISPDAATVTEKGIADVKVAAVEVGADPQEVIVFSGKACVSNHGANTVSVVDLNSRTVTATINVGTEPFGLAAAAFGTDNFLYVTNMGSNTVSVINLASNAVVGTFP